MSESAAHSVAAPSALHMIRQCPGSVVMQHHFPEPPESETSGDAADGTAAHWAMAEWMGGRTPRVGDRAPNGVFLTAEMVEAAELIVDDVQRTIAPHGLTLSDCITEVPLSISRIHKLCWGTPDIRVWLPNKTLVVWDLKFGRRYVPAFENDQTLAYSVGAIEQAGLDDLEVTCINRIVQPRSYHSDGPVREWRYFARDARAQVNILATAVERALGPDPKTHAGPACVDCRARHACETFQRASEVAMFVAGQSMPHTLSPSALGVELRNVTLMFKLLEARKEALEEQGLAMARAGARVAHHRMASGSGRAEWKRPAAEVIALGRLLNLDLAKPPAAITPQQALARGLPESLTAGYVHRPPGASRLVPDDGSQLRQIFSRPTVPPPPEKAS